MTEPNAESSPAGRWLVQICTYNERENLPRLVPEILQVAPDVDVLVIDDNSPDGTGPLADELAARDARVHVMHRARKQGLGKAILAGLQYAIENGYDYVINLDADFSHPPRYIPALRQAMREADVAIGSRYVPGGAVIGWSLLRHFMSRAINIYSRLLLGLRLQDTSGGFRCYRVAKIAQLDLNRVRARGYSFQQEMLYRCSRLGCRFVEVPITFEDRRAGQSKINWKVSLGAVWIIFRLGLDRLRGKRVTT